MFNREKAKIKNLHGYLQNQWKISIFPMQIVTLITLTKITTVMISTMSVEMEIIVP